MASQSPLKANPLRIPGESLDKEIDDLVRDSVMSYSSWRRCCQDWLGLNVRLPHAFTPVGQFSFR